MKYRLIVAVVLIACPVALFAQSKSRDRGFKADLGIKGSKPSYKSDLGIRSSSAPRSSSNSASRPARTTSGSSSAATRPPGKTLAERNANKVMEARGVSDQTRENPAFQQHVRDQIAKAQAAGQAGTMIYVKGADGRVKRVPVPAPAGGRK